MITSRHNIVLDQGWGSARASRVAVGALADRKMAAHSQFGDDSVVDRSAFSLIEIMVTVALLAIIILGLVAMFNQTRRAFTSSLAQVDVLESGRSAADMIARDLEQMAPGDFSRTLNFYVLTSVNYVPLNTQLANPSDVWTNIVQELLFLTPSPPNNGVWNAIGYRLQTTDESNSVGTLYRFYQPNLTITNTGNNSSNFANLNRSFTTNGSLANATNFNRIIDGVTFFRVLAYEPNGILITNGNTATAQTITVRQGDYYNYDYQYAFYSNAVPAYVEIELGILETQALEKYRSFGPGTQAADNYLTSHPGVVHIFRQRIPIRDVDPSTAFP